MDGTDAAETREMYKSGLEGGLLAAFDVEGERFRVWVANLQTIEQLLELWQGTSTASIPNGHIVRVLVKAIIMPPGRGIWILRTSQ